MTRVLVAAAVLFAAMPGVIVVLASLTAGQSLAFPPQGLSLRWYETIFADADFRDALVTSLTLAAVTSVLAVGMAALAALAIVRYRSRATALIEAMLLSPLAVPHIVIGIGILQLYGTFGLRADLMTLTIGHLIITIPFALRMLITSLAGMDREIEHAAASLGATPRAVLFQVILPQMKVGLIGAAICVFILSFDDVALTVFLVQPGYTTVPIMLFSMAENQVLPSIHAASVILLLASWIGVFLIDRLIGFERFLFPGRTAGGAA
jgi:putative spermidine/putrescine transport system permease protein